MRDLRAALVSIPPLLTDLIRHALMNRAPVVVVAELTDPRSLDSMAGMVDVVVLGAPMLLDAVRAYSTAEILVLSDDLKELRWPAAGRSLPLSTETLTGTLRQIAEDLDLRSPSNPDP
jgi:hypothetical protein